MCLSLFLAQVIGCFMFLLSVAMLVHQPRFKKNMTDFLGSPTLISLSGWLGLIMGLLVVISHNVWVAEWPVVVTIVGWLLLLQAIARVFFPEWFAKTMKDLIAKTGYLLMAWILLIVGVYLIWAGFTN